MKNACNTLDQKLQNGLFMHVCIKPPLNTLCHARHWVCVSESGRLGPRPPESIPSGRVNAEQVINCMKRDGC